MNTLRTTIVALLLVFSTSILAGLTQPVPVVVDLDEMSALGDMFTARTSKNDVEFIGCGVKKFEGDFSFGFCQATDANDVSAVCTTVDAHLLDAIYAAGPYVYIRFDWNEDGDCTRIDVSNNSFYVPNATTKGSN